MTVPYSISPGAAEVLMGANGLPPDLRREALGKLLGDREAVLDLFSEFMGLANSVVENNREMIEIILICEGGMSDREAEKANLPTIFGALNGIQLAEGVDTSRACHGCAFRLGSCANQSPVTTTDADHAGNPGEFNFMCHEDLDERGEPTKGCAGFAQVRARRKMEAAA